MNCFEIAKKTRSSSLLLQSATQDAKNKVLTLIKEQLIKQQSQLQEANTKDLKLAKEKVNNGELQQSLYNRLDLFGKNKFEQLLQGVEQVKSMPDPVNHCTLARELAPGLELYRVSCPVGVLLIIFEARPEVMIQISALALKSGNAVILKGGKEAQFSLQMLHQVLQTAIEKANEPSIPKEAVQLVLGREQVDELLSQDQLIDLVIPRGSNQLVRYIQSNTRIPVLGHADGLCSVYVDKEVDIEQAIPILVDCKTNYPAACNACETILLHEDIVHLILKPLTDALIQKNVEIRAEEKLFQQLENNEKIKVAQVKDFDTEFNDLIVAIKTVQSVEEAIQHINQHGSKHTDCILTRNQETAQLFMQKVDAAGVYWNASTRFADGFRYGFGAEIGVSTNKTHARGPVGLEGLLIYKYKLLGGGHTVGNLSGFTHLPIEEKNYHWLIKK